MLTGQIKTHFLRVKWLQSATMTNCERETKEIRTYGTPKKHMEMPRPWKLWKSKKPDSHNSHRRLEIRRTRVFTDTKRLPAADSHIPTRSAADFSCEKTTENTVRLRNAIRRDAANRLLRLFGE
jgi:hypothetical protein